MANPLVKLGIAGAKLAVKGGKKLAKKINTKRVSANSTDNMTRGPIDRMIGKKRPQPASSKPYTTRYLKKYERDTNQQALKEMYQSAPKTTVRERTLSKKQYYKDIYKNMPEGMDDIPF